MVCSQGSSCGRHNIARYAGRQEVCEQSRVGPVVGEAVVLLLRLMWSRSALVGLAQRGLRPPSLLGIMPPARPEGRVVPRGNGRDPGDLPMMR